MKPDDTICHCHHVSLGKLWHFARRVGPSRPSQMSECLGAGTGCGWCIPILKRIHQEAGASPPDASGEHQAALPDHLTELAPEAYAQQRRQYIDSGQPRNTF